MKTLSPIETVEILNKTVLSMQAKEMQVVIAYLLLLKKQGDVNTMLKVFALDQELANYANTIYMIHGMSKGAERPEKKTFVLRQRNIQTVIYHIEAESIDEALNIAHYKQVEPVMEFSNEVDMTMVDHEATDALAKSEGAQEKKAG